MFPANGMQIFYTSGRTGRFRLPPGECFLGTPESPPLSQLRVFLGIENNFDALFYFRRRHIISITKRLLHVALQQAPLVRIVEPF